MKGSEVETRRKLEVPKTTIGSTRVIDLPIAMKQDLVLFSGTPAYQAILMLMENMLIEARDEAVLIPPAKREERLAALDTAHAMSLCFLRLKEKITYLVDERLGEFRREAAEDALKDEAALEAIILNPINAGY